MNGFLCVDKPQGVTSRDMVNVVQRAVKPAKVGHAGTLDPLATGVLVLAVGKATKLISYVQQMPKRYSATFELGKASDTEDTTGYVIECSGATPPDQKSIDEAVQKFTGEILQLPPKYSALKINGKRAYKLARAGQSVRLKPRAIQVHEIRIDEFDYPILKLDIRCGSGTYVRSLGRDIGADLGIGAVMSALRRLSIGRFACKKSLSIDPTRQVSKDDIEHHLQPMLDGVELPRVHLQISESKKIQHGGMLRCEHSATEIAAIGSENQLLAVLKRTSDGHYRPAINFVAS